METTAVTLDEKRRIETMATINEYEYGHHLVKILQTRKELARQILTGDPRSPIEEKVSAINYCNGLICQILGMPLTEVRQEKI